MSNTLRWHKIDWTSWWLSSLKKHQMFPTWITACHELHTASIFISITKKQVRSGRPDAQVKTPTTTHSPLKMNSLNWIIAVDPSQKRHTRNYTSQAHNQFYAKYTKSHEFYFCFRPEKVQPSSASNGFLTVWMFVYKKDPAVQTPKAAPTLFFTQLKLWTIYANLQYFATKSISSFSLNCVQLGPSTTTDSLVNLFLFCWPRWLEDFLSSVRRAEYKMSFYPWPYRKREMEEI